MGTTQPIRETLAPGYTQPGLLPVTEVIDPGMQTYLWALGIGAAVSAIASVLLLARAWHLRPR